MARKKGLSRGWKILIGVGGGLTVAYFISSNVQAALGGLFRPKQREEEDEEPTPEVEEPGAAAGGGAGAARASTRVPGKTGTGKYNQSMFPSPEAVRGALAGLSMSAYSAAQFEETFNAALGAYQADWNDLSDKGLLLPKRLNGTHLAQDEVAGPQTLRALEWSVGMDWPTRLHAAGLQA